MGKFRIDLDLRTIAGMYDAFKEGKIPDIEVGKTYPRTYEKPGGSNDVLTDLEKALFCDLFTIRTIRIDTVLSRGINSSIHIKNIPTIDQFLDARSYGLNHYKENCHHLNIVLNLTVPEEGHDTQGISSVDSLIAFMMDDDGNLVSDEITRLSEIFKARLEPQNVLLMEGVRKDFKEYVIKRHGNVEKTAGYLDDWLKSSGCKQTFLKYGLPVTDAYTMAARYDLMNLGKKDFKDFTNDQINRGIGRAVTGAMMPLTELAEGTSLYEAASLTSSVLVDEILTYLGVLFIL